MKIELMKTLGGWSVRRSGVELAMINPHGERDEGGSAVPQPLSEVQAEEVERVLNKLDLAATLRGVCDTLGSLVNATATAIADEKTLRQRATQTEAPK